MAPRVGFMVHAGQVQQAVQHQDAQFVLDAVAQFGGLRRGAVERDRNIFRAETTARRWRNSFRETLGSASADSASAAIRQVTRLPRQNLLRQIFQKPAQLSLVAREAMGAEITPTLSV